MRSWWIIITLLSNSNILLHTLNRTFSLFSLDFLSSYSAIYARIILEKSRFFSYFLSARADTFYIVKTESITTLEPRTRVHSSSCYSKLQHRERTSLYFSSFRFWISASFQYYDEVRTMDSHKDANSKKRAYDITNNSKMCNKKGKNKPFHMLLTTTYGLNNSHTKRWDCKQQTRVSSSC